MRITLPEQLVERARKFADGELTPAEPRNAATVVLMRPGHAGPEVYLLRRQTSMEFAGGFCVFPGGGVDPRDFDADVGWYGDPPAAWAGRLGVDEDLARALVCAAVRETFEESGVLLAGDSADSVVADPTGEDWEADRAALEARELAFTEFLARRGLSVRADLLGVWSGWLTPVFEPKRYRTWFFVAALPSGQVTRDVSTESDEVTWIAAGGAADRVDDGEFFMLPPTYMTCLEVAQHATPDAVLATAAGREVQMFTPQVEPVDGKHLLSIPERMIPLLTARAGGTP